MAHLELHDLDKKFNELSIVPFIGNDFNLDSEEDKDKFNQLVYTHYDGESLKLTPSCECRRIRAEYRLGELCEHCGTVCSSKYSGEPDSLIWIVTPPGVEKFIKPVVWIMLTACYREKGVDVIRWLCDPHYRPTRRLPESINTLRKKGHQRSYNYFVENFYQIIDDLSVRNNGRVFKKHQATYELIQQNKEALFCKALPVPSKTVLVLEKNRGGRYFDKNLYPAIDAVLIAANMGKLDSNTQLRKIESKVVNIISKLAEFFSNFNAKILTGKYGGFRKHYFAGRMHFSARQVITSQHEPHNADELTLPWTAAVKLFTEHLRSKLLKAPYHYDVNKVSDVLRFAANNYDPVIDKLLNQIIHDDTPYRGFPCLFSRPPILTRGSIQFFYITDIIKDPSVNTIRISPLVLVMPNADFDGDAMHVTLLLDRGMHDAFKVLAPAFTILDPDNPNALSAAIKMPSPVIATTNNWLLEGDIALAEYINNENSKNDPNPST